MIVSDSVTTGSHTAESNNYTIESGESAMQVSGCTNEYQEVPIATANGSPTCATTSSTSSSSSVPVNQGTGGGNSGGGDGGGNRLRIQLEVAPMEELKMPILHCLYCQRLCFVLRLICLFRQRQRSVSHNVLYPLNPLHM